LHRITKTNKSFMRLGQLARKLAISPTDIIKFLESNSIPALEGSNTRLTDDHSRLILQKFDPTGTITLTEPSDEAEPTPVAELAVAKAEQIQVVAPVAEPEPVAAEAEPINQASVDMPTSESTSVQTEEATGLPDVIKAQKVALAGLKVLGKIELPGPKKKEPSPEDTTTPEDTAGTTESIPTEGTVPTPQPQQERRPRRERDGRESDRRDGRDSEGEGRRSRRGDDNRRNDKPRKNTIAAQREREAQEAQLKREAQAKAEKERRTQHYQNRVKSVPTRPARLLREQTEEFIDDQVPTPTTWLGKFWKWFRS
jgi:hypothetical protein